MAVAVSLAAAAPAPVLEGSFSSTSYLFEPLRRLDDPDPPVELDLINRLSLDGRNMGHRDLSVYFFGALRGEALDEGLGKSRFNLYRGHIRYTPSRKLSLTVGRQWAHGGVGSTLFDGGQLRIRHTLGSLVLFGGSRGHLDRPEDSVDCLCDDGWNESGVAGVSYRSPEFAGSVSIGLSGSRTMRDGSEESERLGVLGSWRPMAGTSLFYEHSYELNQETSYYQHLRASRRLRSGKVSLAWNRREGYLPEFENTYIFRHFQDQIWFPAAVDRTTQEFRGDISVEPERLKGWRLSLGVIEIFPEDQDRGDGLDLTLGKGDFRIGYRAQRGYRGETDGFHGGYRYRAAEWARIWLDLNRISYRIEYEGLPEVDPESRWTVASRLGLDLRLPHRLDLTTVGEVLDNRAARYEIRFLTRLAYRFNLGATGGGEDQR